MHGGGGNDGDHDGGGGGGGSGGGGGGENFDLARTVPSCVVGVVLCFVTTFVPYRRLGLNRWKTIREASLIRDII